MRRGRIALLPGALAGMLALVALLYVAVALFAYAPASYPQTPPYGEMAIELTDYLAQRADALSPTMFTERERLHMVDVLALFAGGRRIATGCGVAALACVGLALWLGGRRRLGRGLLLGMEVFAALVVLLALWALIDFSGWFTAMHELVFDNDLWLLDPAESMLINMLPLSFFIDACKTIALRFALGALALAAVSGLLMLPERKGEGT